MCFTGLCCFHCACAGRPAPEDCLQHGRTRPHCNWLQWTSTENPQSTTLCVCVFTYVRSCMYTAAMLSLAVVMETSEWMYCQCFLYCDAHWRSESEFFFLFFYPLVDTWLDSCEYEQPCENNATRQTGHRTCWFRADSLTCSVLAASHCRHIETTCHLNPSPLIHILS